MIIDFKIGGKSYSTPEALTLENHYKIQTESILSPTPGFWIVSYLTGCPEDLLRQMSVDDWDELWDLIQYWIIQESTPDHSLGLSPIIKINGEEYGRVNFDTMTIGEFADLDIIVTDKAYDQKLHELVAILYRPVTKKDKTTYEIAPHTSEGFKERSEIFKECPVKLFKKIQDFFLLTSLQSLNSTKTSSPTSPKNLIADKLETLSRLHLSTLGTLYLPDSPEMMYSNWIKLRNSESEKLSTGSFIKRTKEKVKAFFGKLHSLYIYKKATT